MSSFFTEMITFQVKPDKTTEFEALIDSLKPELHARPGCVGIHMFKRFYTFDGVELGQPPRELTRIVKCVKYFAYWEFDTIDACGCANGWLFENHSKNICKLLIMPFEINSGYSI